MSHYSVAVITKSGTEEEVVNLLSPFNENLDVEPYMVATKKEAIEEGKEEAKTSLEYYIKQKEKLEKDIDNHFSLLSKEEYENRMDDINEEIKKYSDYDKWTDEQYYQEYINYNFGSTHDIGGLKEDGYIDDEGNIYDTYNENSKWDWYVIGGRFKNLLKIKGENTLSCDSEKISNVDFEYKKPEYIEYQKKFWEFATGEIQPTEEEKKQYLWGLCPSKESLIGRYGTKENYLKKMSEMRTYAILLPDGTWYEPGKMGWFGLSNAETDAEREFDENYFKILDREKYKDYYITIVDCHI